MSVVGNGGNGRMSIVVYLGLSLTFKYVHPLLFLLFIYY